MDKETAENFIYKCFKDNEEKKIPKEKISRKEIVEILTEDHGIPVATAYRYYKDQWNLYKWETSRPDPDKQLKDSKDEILSNILDSANDFLTDGKVSDYCKTIDIYSKLLVRFKKQ
jgi:hypothetical protein|tara:strand:+ start:408 stop:755 length:348 start_codon:yes stop_codon:yes gene_type:complete